MTEEELATRWVWGKYMCSLLPLLWCRVYLCHRALFFSYNYIVRRLIKMGSTQQQQREIATLNSLADQIKELAAKMTKQLEAENIPPVTLEANSPIKYERLPGDLFMTRSLLEDALRDMWILSQGPSESVFNYVHMAIPDASCLNILNQFEFWTAVPVDGEASFEKIAQKVQLPLEVVSRVLDHAITMRFFTKPSPTATSVRHTSVSVHPLSTCETHTDFISLLLAAIRCSRQRSRTCRPCADGARRDGPTHACSA